MFERCGCVDESGKPRWRSCSLLSRGTHGSWAYRVDLGPGIDRDGEFRRRRQRYRSGFPTKAAAMAALTELSANVNQGNHVEASRLSVGVYLQQWLEGRTRLRPTTRESYERYLERYFLPLLGHTELRQLRAIDIEGAYAQIRTGSGWGVKRTETIKPATLLRLHAVLKAAPNTAVRRDAAERAAALGPRRSKADG